MTGQLAAPIGAALEQGRPGQADDEQVRVGNRLGQAADEV